MRQTYTFDDVALVPQYNNIPSRTATDLSTWITKDDKMDIPILAANMDTVIGDELADVLLQYGSIPIFHRYTDFDTQAAWIKKYGQKIYISMGLNNRDQVRQLLDLGPKGVCIDIAHGHSLEMLKCIEDIKSTHPHIKVIAGNVCTAMAFHDLANAGADAIKAGVGPGSHCSTRMVTGFGVPQFTAIQDCANIALKLRVPLIADGGIRNSRDIVLALAAGASTVMIGKLFATAIESAARKQIINNIIHVKYRGQASADFQKDFYGEVKKNTVPEGVSSWMPCTGHASDILDELLGGIRSGLTYGGANNIKELQRKAEFVKVMPTYGAESNTRV